MSVPLVSIALALITSKGLLALSGLINFLLGPLLAANGFIMGKKMINSIPNNDNDKTK